MATMINAVRENTNMPQKAYEFEIEVLGSSSSGTFPLFTQRVKSVSIPSFANEVFEVNFKGKRFQHVGRDTSAKTVSVELYDHEDREAYTFFYNWISSMNSAETGGGVDKSIYQGEVIIRTYASDSSTVTGTNRLINAWPSEVGDVSLDYTNSDAMAFSVTFSFDEMFID